MKQLIIAIKVTLVFALLTGIAYPLLVTGLSKVLFHHQAEGSLIPLNDKIVGSELIGQRFTRPEYFHGRPSSAGNDGYDGLSSSPSNLGPTNQHLIERVQGDLKKFRDENPTFTGPVPADLLTASGSGLDPHISPASAEAQVARVAAARGASPDTIRQVVAANTQGRQFGFLGEPRVNVLQLNLALDQAAPLHK
ncbi:potassium translocating ATPase, subunit C [Candidatus Sulfopaludibacter sp. SbA6]|nr:potassium translocating ATPase, subunit C [Candidatus Sulfopaludibacter sp. SbA6]